jgi:hypothetical protein
MSDFAPVLNQIDLVVRDIGATIAGRRLRSDANERWEG